jgi:ankyrin repeat protein
MLDRGADPRLATRVEGQSGIVIAARRGRGDALKLFEQRGVSNRLDGFDGLAAACAKHELPEARRLSLDSPGLRQQLKTEGGRLLAEFAGNGNTEGVSLLLELGVDLKAVFEQGDGYFDIAKRSTALHVAAWRARHRTVELLLVRGAPVNTLDGKGRSALALAVRACVDSYWQARRAPDSVRALLRAGASVAGIKFPCGYSPVDELLQAHGAVASG